MSKVELYEEYTREEVNNIFNADVPFTLGAGIYGMHGLIRVKKKIAILILYSLGLSVKINWDMNLQKKSQKMGN